LLAQVANPSPRKGWPHQLETSRDAMAKLRPHYRVDTFPHQKLSRIICKIGFFQDRIVGD